MRITDRSALDQALRQIQGGQERLQRSLSKAASGIQVQRPSDDPVGFTEIRVHDEMLTRLAGYNRNIALVRARLGATESALQSMLGLLSRMRELIMMDLNVAISGPEVPLEAQQVYEQLLQVVNQSYNGEPLFSGYRSGPPFVGPRFVGDNEKRAVEISPLGATIFGVSAQEAFGVVPGGDIFRELAEAVAGMRTGNRAAVRAGLGAVDHYLGLITQAMASLGAQQNTLSLAERANEAYALQLRSAMARRRDIDPAASYSQLAADRYAMEATFAVIANSGRLSLIKYL
ncbi:MAG: hypothetical protein RMK29_16670 [Myxococcales bacterium]|nr:hypothetical protein [Myxococcota bacterium]MDW8283342.1 hypothetical protein [Myxococcales bacterium]